MEVTCGTHTLEGEDGGEGGVVVVVASTTTDANSLQESSSESDSSEELALSFHLNRCRGVLSICLTCALEMTRLSFMMLPVK